MKKRLTINLSPEAMEKLDFMAEATDQSDSHVVSVALDALWVLAPDSTAKFGDPRIAGMMAAIRAKLRECEEREKSKPSKSKKG